MSAKSGELARETASYRCQNCHHEMLVSVGYPIEHCPNCGGDTFDTGWVRQPKEAPKAEELSNAR